MTTLQNILATLRGANILPAAKINYGISDSLPPPYLSVRDYSHTFDYQTCGSKFKHARFTLLVVDKSQDDAENIAAQFDALLNLSRTLTPNTDVVFQESYKVGQLDFSPTLYQFGVEVQYTLTENE